MQREAGSTWTLPRPSTSRLCPECRAEFWRILDGRADGGPLERPASDCLALLHPMDTLRALEYWQSLQQPSREPRPPVLEVEYRVQRRDGGEPAAVRSLLGCGHAAVGAERN